MLVTTTPTIEVDASPAIMASFPVKQLSVPMYSAISLPVFATWWVGEAFL